MGLSAYCLSRKQDSNPALNKKKYWDKIVFTCVLYSYSIFQIYMYDYWIENLLIKFYLFSTKFYTWNHLFFFHLIKVPSKWIVEKTQTSNWIHGKVIKNKYPLHIIWIFDTIQFLIELMLTSSKWTINQRCLSNFAINQFEVFWTLE